MNKRDELIEKIRPYIKTYGSAKGDDVRLNRILNLCRNEVIEAVNSVEGNFYVGTPDSISRGEVERKIDFGEDGDYEGIEIIGNDAWVLKSNGTLYKINNYLDELENNVEKYPTILTRKNDAEALAYDPENGNLLIGCKGYPFVTDKKGKDYKSVFEFKITSKLLSGSIAVILHLNFSAINNVGTPDPQPASNILGFSHEGSIEMALSRYFKRPFLQ